MIKNFKGKTAVVTGAGNGFGAVVAEEAARRGMNVVLADIVGDDVQRTLTSCKKLGVKGVAYTCDMSLYENCKTVVEGAVKEFGTVDLMFNNAGVSFPGFIWDVPITFYEHTMAINVMQHVYMMSCGLPYMIKQGTEAHIVNTASVAGLATSPYISTYYMSKNAVVAVSESICYDLELSQNTHIGISVYCPSFVQTTLYRTYERIPERFQTPEFDAYKKTDLYQRAVAGATKSITEGRPLSNTPNEIFNAVERNQFYIIPHPEDILYRVEIKANNILKYRNPSLATVGVNKA